MLHLNDRWLMSRAYFATVEHAYTTFEIDEEKFEAFIERRSKLGSGEERFAVRDGTARIPIIGALTTRPDYFFSLFGDGNAIYGDISQAVREANADPNVERIVLEISSPGGEVAGFFDTARVIANSQKPVEAQVTDMAASAAFGLAVQADRVVVNNPMAEVGSVGIVTSQFVSDSRVIISSTEAPKKAPDATTDAGIVAIREELDPLHAEFAGLIASGRSRATGKAVSVDDVNRDFGRGALVIGRAAMAAGLIDAINSDTTQGGSPVPGTSDDQTETETDAMTREEFQAKHPEIYAAILADGKKAGIDQERDRVSAHVTAGKSCGNTEVALGFIESGEDFSSQKVQASYFAARGKATALADITADGAVNQDAGTGTPAAGDAKPEDKEAAAAAEHAMFDDIAVGYGIKPEATR